MIPPIEKLLRHLSYGGSNGSMELTSAETDEITDQALPWKGERLPWNGPTCFAVVCYVIKFAFNLDNTTLNDTIRRLNDLASESDAAWWEWAGDYESPERWVMESIIKEKQQEIAEMFVNHFMPQVQKFFRVPNVQQLSATDKSLKKNETLAGFIDFLLQILNSESLISLAEEQKYALLRKELTFLLTFLGDVPFQLTELEEVENILAEFETLANKAGSFVYSCVFSTRPVKTSRFSGGRGSLLEEVEHLYRQIKEHCLKFVELPRCATPRTNGVDSLFIVDSLLEDLENLMNHHFNFTIDSMKNQIKSLHEELLFSRSVIKDIKQLHGKEVAEAKELYGEIRDVAYEAEYLIHSHVVGNAPFWYLNLRLPTVIKKIEAIGIRLQGTKKNYDIEVLETVKDFTEEASSQVTASPKEVADKIVKEFEDEKAKILDDLIEGSEIRKVISIFGMPGLGKTTVAKNLYKDRAISDHFEVRIWYVVSEAYDKRKVLTDILMSLPSKLAKEEIKKMEDGKLGLKIYEILMGRRYLIVMDDVWHSNMWDDLIRYFPDGKQNNNKQNKESRIMLTSRSKLTAPRGSIFHTLPLLSEAQCWDLFVEKIFSEKSCPSKLLDVGKRIMAKCHKLPLVVVVIAGLLANLEQKENVWKEVEGNLDSYIFDDPSVCIMKTLELSYNHLPDHLKPCFLYLGAFPEAKEIPARKLILLWIAEGFVRKEQEKTPEHIGEKYLTELINRSLLMIERRRSDGQIKSCSVHDLMRDLCLRKAYGENFLKSIKENFSFYEKHHHLCFNSRTPTYWRTFGLHCRSYLGHLSDPSSCFPQMPLLRVMELLPIWGGSSKLKRINLLVHLRYLVVDRMPEPVVGNLVNLEVLCVQGDDTHYVPSTILTMVNLKHLHIEKEALFEKDCNNNHQTTNLRSLSLVRIANHEDEKILKSSPHLRVLKCRCDGNMFPDVGSFTELESLKMVYRSPFNGELSKIKFPTAIKKLTLSGIGLPWAEMSIVGKLPNLQVLKLVSNAFVGEEWNATDDEFQELMFLRLEEVDLKKWTAQWEFFPKLQFLVLRLCWELEEIPNDLGNVSTLQKIEVSNSSYEASISAVKIEIEQQEYGNEELKVIINNHKWSKEKLVYNCTEQTD